MEPHRHELVRPLQRPVSSPQRSRSPWHRDDCSRRRSRSRARRSPARRSRSRRSRSRYHRSRRSRSRTYNRSRTRTQQRSRSRSHGNFRARRSRSRSNTARFKGSGGSAKGGMKGWQGSPQPAWQHPRFKKGKGKGKAADAKGQCKVNSVPIGMMSRFSATAGAVNAGTPAPPLPPSPYQDAQSSGGEWDDVKQHCDSDDDACSSAQAVSTTASTSGQSIAMFMTSTVSSAPNTPQTPHRPPPCPRMPPQDGVLMDVARARGAARLQCKQEEEVAAATTDPYL